MEGSGESIPKGWHVHHLIPRSEGGPDEYWNLICVSPEMHYDIHFVRGDYGACALISDGIDREAPTKTVRQYDLDGFFIKRYNSVNDAGLDTGFDTGNIAGCCRYRDKSCEGYQWFYESEVGDIDYIGPVKRKCESGGNNTSRVPVLDLMTGIFYSGKRAAARAAWPHKSWSGSLGNSEMFKERFV